MEHLGQTIMRLKRKPIGIHRLDRRIIDMRVRSQSGETTGWVKKITGPETKEYTCCNCLDHRTIDTEECECGHELCDECEIHRHFRPELKSTRKPVSRESPFASVVNEQPQRKPSNRDKFDGPHQTIAPLRSRMDQPLILLPTSIQPEEQGGILDKRNTILQQCIYNFLAEFQFPIPTEAEKKLVLKPYDHTWTE
jgi:hypothetical protein